MTLLTTPHASRSTHEYRGNIHMHTVYSDGAGQPAELIAAAQRTGLDFIIVTDHNTLVDQQLEGWHGRVLALFDIEVNDRDRNPEDNHCLTLGVQEDVTPFAPNAQGLIDAVRERGGLTFLAHPIDKPSPFIPNTYPWTQWDIEGYTGIELWNFMSEFRPHVTTKLRALAVGFFPWWFSTGPFPEMLAKWDELLQAQPTIAIGGSDAHANTFNLGPIRRKFLPYEYCFRAVNTHILTLAPFQHDAGQDRTLVYEALGAGRCWIGYDRVHPTEGFRFVAKHGSEAFQMGERVQGGQPITLAIECPATAEIRLLRAGAGVVAQAVGKRLSYTTSTPGAYRVEVWKRWRGKMRGWIFSNPIYVV